MRLYSKREALLFYDSISRKVAMETDLRLFAGCAGARAHQFVDHPVREIARVQQSGSSSIQRCRTGVGFERAPERRLSKSAFSEPRRSGGEALSRGQSQTPAVERR